MLPIEQRLPRIVGCLYLVLAAVGSFPLYVRGRLFVANDPEMTAANIIASENLFRFGMLSEVAVGLVWGAIAFCLFILLKPTRPMLATLFFAMVLVGVAVLHGNVAHLAAIMNYTVAPDLGEEITLLVSLFHRGESAWALWAGLWLVPLGIAVYQSRIAPRAFGVLLALASLGYILPIIFGYVAPEIRSQIRGLIVPAGVIELSFGLWLLVRGKAIPAS